MSLSEYGLKIKTFAAGSLYAYNNGTRERYDYKGAFLTNSLFLDFLKENGLSTYKDVSTRDVVSISFDYGSRSYEEEKEHLIKAISKLEKNEGMAKEEKEQKLSRYKELLDSCELNKDLFVKKSAQQIRDIFYSEGVDIEYYVHDKKGRKYHDTTIHYKFLWRTPGKAKKGHATFINEELYDAAHDFLYMGLTLPEQNTPIVEMGAYSSLITSTIVDRVQIDPRHIFFMEDVESYFETNVVSIEIDDNKNCQAIFKENYKLKNILWDGMSLIDSSLFPDDGDGFILLRHHMFKSAAFCSHIQKFFKDYYGDQYESTVITDMFGIDHYVKDIQMISTDNSIKFLKFGVSYDYWCDRVNENNNLFGIVKTAHPSKLGEVQRMSYQHMNTLSMESMPDVVENSLEYINQLKSDDSVFLDYLRSNVNFSNDYKVLVALCEQDPVFVRSQYYRDRKYQIIKNYVKNFKSGKVIQNADNLVLAGSVYAMLLHAVGENTEDDDTFDVEEDAIQCFTERFEDGEYLAGFRNPHNSQHNIVHLHNVYHEKFFKYFDLGKQILIVNVQHTDIQDRLNGCDFDSDMAYVTNLPAIVAHAKTCMSKYSTIVNNIPKEKNTYTNDISNYALIDNKLAASQSTIGESSNLAQLALCYGFSFPDEQKYKDYVCILSVLAQCAIDNAKRSFDIDLVEEIKRIKKDMNIKENGYPKFWSIIRRGFNKARINNDLVCPMNYIYDLRLAKFKAATSTLPMKDFFVKFDNNEKSSSRKVEDLIQKYSFELYNYNVKSESNSNEYILLRHDFEKLIEDIRKTYISKNYLGLMSWLINRAFVIGAGVKRNKNSIQSTINNNRALLIKTLYDVNPDAFLKCFSGRIDKNNSDMNTVENIIESSESYMQTSIKMYEDIDEIDAADMWDEE